MQRTFSITLPRPTANDDSYTTARNTTLRVNAPGVRANDSFTGTNVKAVLENNVRHGTLTLRDDGSFRYVPDQDYRTTPDSTESFTYHDEDQDGNKSNSATVTLTVGSPPTANDDSYTTKRGASLVVHADTGVLANDTDAENPTDPITALIDTRPDPQKGTLQLFDDGSFQFDPQGNFSGDVTFKYKAKDIDGLSSAATVTVTVGIKPTAIPHSYTVNANEVLRTDSSNGVLAGASDDPSENDPITAKLKTGPQHGRLLRDGLPDGLNDDGSFNYVPNTDYRGPDSFTYVAHDVDGDSSVQTVTIQVGKVPAVKEHSYVVPRNPDGSLAPLVVDSSDLPYQRLLADATPGETGVLTAFQVVDPAKGGILPQHGTVGNFSAGGGSFTYTVTDPTFHGQDKFTFKAKDGDIESNLGTVTITIGAVPVAKPHSYTTGRGNPLDVGVDKSLLSDATDAEHDTITAVKKSDPTHGVISNFDPSKGTFTYTPNDDQYSGDDTFTYQAEDSDGRSDPQTVTITIGLKPTATDHPYSVQSNTTRHVDRATGLRPDTTDGDGDPVIAKVKTLPLHGDLTGDTVNDDGSFDYTPDRNLPAGTTDTFTFFLHDDKEGDSDTKTVTLTIGQAPVVKDQDYKVQRNGTLTVAAPNPGDSDKRLIHDATNPAGGTLTVIKDDDPGNGTITEFGTDGSFTYVPNTVPTPGFHGQDSFHFHVVDPSGATSNVGKATITVGSPPETKDIDPYVIPRNTRLFVNKGDGVIGQGDNRQYTDDEDDTATAVLSGAPSNATFFQLNPDGSFTYEPNTDFHGTDSFKYLARDVDGDSDPATVEIKVGAPVAKDHKYYFARGDRLTVPVDNGVLSDAQGFGGDQVQAFVKTDGSRGHFSLDPNGSFSYTPGGDLAAFFTGTDSFKYVVRNQFGDASAPAKVTIYVGVPEAKKRTYTVARDTPTTISRAKGLLKGNFTDAEGDPVTALIQPPPADHPDDRSALPEHGTADVFSDGSFTYTPAVGYSGDDRFMYIARDVDGDSAPAKVKITVGAPPDVQDHTYSTPVNTALATTRDTGVGSDASDDENDRFTLTLKDAAAGVSTARTEHGTVIFDSDGSFTYTPDTGYRGPDHFQYLAHDQDGDSDPATVTITVGPITVNNKADNKPVYFTSSASFAGPIAAFTIPDAQKPPGVDFPIGLFQFQVIGMGPGGSATVTLVVPSDDTVNSYWKFGPTPDNLSPHWYDFAFDGTTGAEISGNQVTLHFVDGQRGDDDVNNRRRGLDGVILEPGGPAFVSAPPPGTPSQRFVSRLYEDLLGREADPQGLAFFTAVLDRGRGSRFQVALSLATSPEYYTRQVVGLYRALLGRDADPAGLAGGLHVLESGGTREGLETILLASPEYFRRRGGGTSSGFLAALYHDVLGRAVDPAGARAWGVLLAGAEIAGPPVDLRALVAALVLTSPEAGVDRVEDWYGRTLRRPADAGGLRALLAGQRLGMSDEQALAILAGSDEYFTR